MQTTISYDQFDTIRRARCHLVYEVLEYRHHGIGWVRGEMIKKYGIYLSESIIGGLLEDLCRDGYASRDAVIGYRKVLRD